ncbi:MAG: translation initiation factor IF-3, partial [Defluviitaleaceae bacterium]|nr:translation initiation factor IF-3 [Defluviitaleaceae bacterium]
VCKIMDFSKFKFEQSKKEREARKKSKNVETKELWLSPNIDKNDVEVRVKRAIEFLKKGDKVKITVRFRHGREMGRTSVANTILDDFAKAVADFGTVDRGAKLDGRRMSMFLVPRKDIVKDIKKDAEPESEVKNQEEQKES